ncbi:kinesin motor domain protein [Oesophagostomum dentatum]|uniref:Kinesin motor domain protein n=1 Tax=Oesophagostomum dentatum TaxID=61180 RepID=A0A0B1TMY3_OESDE|nr:kinesin motor domain protein [Oesophagostomum dentatum]
MSSDIPVKVYVRSRPFSDKERLENARECLQFFVESNQISCNGKTFAFDGVLDPQTPQDSVYDITAASLLEQFFKGFNCTILAYGQTGSGKTYTMGTEETLMSMQSDNRGIIPRLVQALFRQISECGVEQRYHVYVSMLEIYDEKVHDLLSPSKEPLQVREQGGVVFVQGLSKCPVQNLVETMGQLEKGGLLRSKGETAMNAQSSRSHAIFTITLEKAEAGDDDNGFTAKLHLVDLAGSERLKKTQAEGARKMEGIRINEGLLALGNVISALSEPGVNRHIPYRDSKITRLLQDSLGGNSYTMMIACVSPADSNAEETLSTLRYADRAKKIKNKPVVNVDPGQQKIRELKERVAALERELAETRMGIAPCTADNNITTIEVVEMRTVLAEKERLLNEAHGKTAEAICKQVNLLNQLQHVESQRERLKSAVTQALDAIKGSGETHDDDIAHKISEIFAEQLADEEEMDPSLGNILHGDTDEEGMDETFSVKFVDQQASLNKELEEVMQQIKDKEDMLTKSIENQKNVDELLKKHKQEMADLQQRIDSLLSEKAKLEADLKKVSISNRLAEERRKKLQEMEKQLATFRKQMNEMKRLEKQRQQSEEAQKRMQAEICELKKAKVRMVKQQKEEAEKYRQWKLKHDRELLQMKQKERKRDLEAAREKRVHDQQMLVYKQKLEDASRVNKRLHAQMEKAAAFSREKPESEKLLSHAKARSLSELSLIGSSYEAELMCQSLKEQRRQLSRKKTRLQRQKEAYVSSEEPPAKRRSTEHGPALSPEDEETLRKIDEELKNIDQQQILCSDELNKLQRGCGSIDVDSRAETRWKDLYTAAAARVYLKVLFEQAANERRAVIDLEKEVKQLQRTLKEQEGAARDEKKLHQEQISEMHDQNRRLALKFDKLKTETEMQFLNLIARINTCQVMDQETLQEFRGLCENFDRANQLRNEIKTTKTSKPSRRSRTSKPLTRSHSSSSIEPIVLTTEEERRTRALRARIHRDEDMKDPLKVIASSDSEEEQSIADTSYHPSEARDHQTRRRTKKLVMVSDLSPIPDLTQLHHDTTNENSLSPRSRRHSMLLHQPPLKFEDEDVKENIANETFVVHSGTPNSFECAGRGDEILDDVNPLRNATLVSGLIPHVDPDLGPLDLTYVMSGSKRSFPSWTPSEIISAYSEKNINYLFDWQAEIVEWAEANSDNIVYCAPTSAGKSIVAELIGNYYCMSNRRRKLNAVFSFAGLIVIDELHMVFDSSRGIILESLCAKVNLWNSRNPTSRIRVIGMSATLENLEMVGEWLQAKVLYTCQLLC